MTNLSDNALTIIEFAVLARLSQPATTKAPTKTELAEALILMELAANKELANKELTTTLASLQQQELAAPTPKAARQRTARWAMTDRGAKALRDVLDLPRTPMWTALCKRYLPALQLGLTSNIDPSHADPGSLQSMSIAIVASRLGVSPSSSSAALCDALIADELKMPANMKGALTLTSIRAWVLNQRLQHAGIEVRESVKTKKDLDIALRKAAVRTLEVKTANRWLFLGKLRNQALYKITKLRSRSSGRPPLVNPQPLPVKTSDQTLLSAVNEAIPRIGSDGRHGPEKVFVSAIWRTLEGDRQVGDLSIEKFKGWLIEANRRRVLDLARADHVTAMDGKQVAESEIQDFGATFHFVLDRHADLPGSDKGFHARKA